MRPHHIGSYRRLKNLVDTRSFDVGQYELVQTFKELFVDEGVLEGIVLSWWKDGRQYVAMIDAKDVHVEPDANPCWFGLKCAYEVVDGQLKAVNVQRFEFDPMEYILEVAMGNIWGMVDVDTKFIIHMDEDVGLSN